MLYKIKITYSTLYIFKLEGKIGGYKTAVCTYTKSDKEEGKVHNYLTIGG